MIQLSIIRLPAVPVAMCKAAILVPIIHAPVTMIVVDLGNIVPVALVQPIQPNVRFIVSRTISPIVVVVLQIVMGFIVMAIVQGLVMTEDLR